MPKRKDINFVFDDGEDTVAIIDDDEANEDLSLKILEKALSRRDVENNFDSDLSDSGVVSTVMVNEGKSKVKNSESNKKMKRHKLEAAHEIPEDDEVEKSTEPKTGETSRNLVLDKLLRGARYFDPLDAGWVTCYSCGEQGHITVNCPTPTKPRKPCFICGSLEHGAKQCSKGHDCYICNRGGHRAKDCPDKYNSGSKGAVCLRCGDFGHDMILCKYEYSKEDLKDIQCYVCKSFGHLCCVKPDNSPSWAVSCYRCGQLGHTGLACGRHYDESNENDFFSPSFSKFGGERHYKSDRPNSSSVHFRENSREEGNFSSSINTSQGRDSPSVCYKSKGAGQFARECPKSNSSQDKLDIYLTRNFHLMQCIDQLLSE